MISYYYSLDSPLRSLLEFGFQPCDACLHNNCVLNKNTELIIVAIAIRSYILQSSLSFFHGSAHNNFITDASFSCNESTYTCGTKS